MQLLSEVDLMSFEVACIHRFDNVRCVPNEGTCDDGDSLADLSQDVPLEFLEKCYVSRGARTNSSNGRK